MYVLMSRRHRVSDTSGGCRSVIGYTDSEHGDITMRLPDRVMC